MTLPNRKVLSTFVLTFGLVAFFIIVFGGEKADKIINVSANLVAGERVSIPENQNWQNEMGNINVSMEKASAAATTEDENNLTDNISKSLVGNYLVLKQDSSFNTNTAQVLVDSAVKLTVSGEPSLVKISDLKIIPDNGKPTMYDYGGALGSLLKEQRLTNSINELEIIKELTETKDLQKISEIDAAINVYKEFATDLKKMPVPQTFIKAHLDMLNGILSLTYGLEEVKHVVNDPLRGLKGLKIYEEGGSLFLQAIQATVQFINQNDIKYKQGSGGYYLLYGI